MLTQLYAPLQCGNSHADMLVLCVPLFVNCDVPAIHWRRLLLSRVYFACVKFYGRWRHTETHKKVHRHSPSVPDMMRTAAAYFFFLFWQTKPLISDHNPQSLYTAYYMGSKPSPATHTHKIFSWVSLKFYDASAEFDWHGIGECALCAKYQIETVCVRIIKMCMTSICPINDEEEKKIVSFYRPHISAITIVDATVDGS